MTRGGLLVLTGFSGAGKDAVMAELVDKHGWGRIISHTAGRLPRPGEIHGKDYFFVQEEEFLEMVKNEEFVEYAKPYGNWYGTTKVELEMAEEKKIVWRIDPWTAAKVEQIIPEKLYKRTVSIFLTASEEFRIKRARSRARLEEDKRLWEELVLGQQKFKHIVENREGELERTVAEVLEIVQREVADLP